MSTEATRRCRVCPQLRVNDIRTLIPVFCFCRYRFNIIFATVWYFIIVIYVNVGTNFTVMDRMTFYLCFYIGVVFRWLFPPHSMFHAS